MCGYVIEDRSYEVINEVTGDCPKRREWLYGKYFCLKNECKGCPQKCADKPDNKESGPDRRLTARLLGYATSFRIRNILPQRTCPADLTGNVIPFRKK